jgi:hypothetical protein
MKRKKGKSRLKAAYTRRAELITQKNLPQNIAPDISLAKNKSTQNQPRQVTSASPRPQV